MANICYTEPLSGVGYQFMCFYDHECLCDGFYCDGFEQCDVCRNFNCPNNPYPPFERRIKKIPDLTSSPIVDKCKEFMEGETNDS